MRVVLDISSATPVRTGIGQTTYELAARLPWIASTVECLYYFRSWQHRPPRLPFMQRGPGGWLVEQRMPGPWLLTSWRWLGWPKADRWSRVADLYHAPAMFVPPTEKFPVVATIHDLFFLEAPHWADGAKWGDAYLAATLPRRLPGVRRIICPSPCVARQLLEHFGDRFEGLEQRIDVIPWGVSARWFVAPRRSERKILQRLGFERPYWIAVGTGARRKNIKGLLAGYALACARRRDVPDLLCIGSPPPGVTQLPAGVHFLPYVDRTTLGLLVRHAHALVCASAMEGFGLPLLEAMAAAVAVVTTRRIGVLDFTGDECVWLAREATPEALAEALVAQLDSAQEDGQRRIRQARQLAGALTWRRTCRETYRAYEKALKSH